MEVTVCIGSACHLKGSKKIIEKLQVLVKENGLEEQVNLRAAFCMGNCANGVSVTVDGVVHSVLPETTDAFFADVITVKL